MKKIKANKESFLKKIFIKISRLLGYEIINQNSVFIPTSNKYLNENREQALIIKSSIMLQFPFYI